MKPLVKLFIFLNILFGFFSCEKNLCDNLSKPDLKVSKITDISVEASWAAITDAFDYNYVLTEEGSTSVIKSDNTTQTSVSLQGLTANKKYTVRVTPRCSQLKVSTVFASSNFTTLSSSCNLPAPTNVTVQAFPTSVNVNFGLVPSAVNYKVDIFTNTVPQTFVTTTTVNQPPATLTGLTPGTSYTAVVSAGCGGGQFSPNNTRVIFTTPIVIEDDIVMFAKMDKFFADSCLVTSSGVTPVSGLPANITLIKTGLIPTNGMHHIIVKQGTTIKCAFRLYNLYASSMGIMKFCYKEGCPDTPSTLAPSYDTGTGFINKDFGTDGKMIVRTSRDVFQISIPIGYSIFVESKLQ